MKCGLIKEDKFILSETFGRFIIVVTYYPNGNGWGDSYSINIKDEKEILTAICYEVKTLLEVGVVLNGIKERIYTKGGDIKSHPF